MPSTASVDNEEKQVRKETNEGSSNSNTVLEEGSLSSGSIPEAKKRRIEKISKWDKEFCGELIKLSNDNKTMETFITDVDQWSCVMASNSTDIYRIRIDKLGKMGDLWIGYCRQVGFVPNGSTRGRFCQVILDNDTPSIEDETSHAFKQGDIITVIHKKNKETIEFLKNGQDIGIEYENVSTEPRYPAIVTSCNGVVLTLVE